MISTQFGEIVDTQVTMQQPTSASEAVSFNVSYSFVAPGNGSSNGTVVTVSERYVVSPQSVVVASEVPVGMSSDMRCPAVAFPALTFDGARSTVLAMERQHLGM